MSKISLSMIIKNEEKNLSRCLESVKDIIDEIVIVDTGSTDNSIHIANQYNAKIISHKWNDNFSEARNIALRNCKGDFILYLDADEILSQQSISEIRKLTKSNEKIGYYCTITSIDDFTKQNNSIQYIRFFSNSDKIEFRGKVHEQIVDSLIQNNYKILKSNIEIIHFGYNISKEEKKIKAQRNLKLLLNNSNKSYSSYDYFQIAQSYFILENFKEAEKYFNLVIDSKNLAKDFLAESYSYLAQIAHFNFDIITAETNIKKAISLNNNQPFYHYLLSKVYQRRMDYQNSFICLKKAFELNTALNLIKKNNLQSVHLNNYVLLLSLINLTRLNNDSKNLTIYTNELLKEIKKTKSDKEEHFRLFINILTNKLTPAKNNLQELFTIIDENNFDLIIQLLDSIPEVETRLELLIKLNDLFPINIEVLKRIAIVYDNLCQIEKAIKLFENNFNKIVEDPSTLFYLASFYIKSNNFAKALEIFDLIENKFPYISSLNSNVKEIKQRIERIVEK